MTETLIDEMMTMYDLYYRKKNKKKLLNKKKTILSKINHIMYHKISYQDQESLLPYRLINVTNYASIHKN